jgi:hypothetical protein
MAPPPTDKMIAAGIAALRDDAAAWLTAAAALADAAAALAGPPLLDPEAFGLAGLRTGLAALYDDLHRQTVDRLSQAPSTFTATAVALRFAADGYERDERDAVHRLRGIW